MKLAAIVVFYNPTSDNIENIKNYEQSVDKIYVVDNSDDNNIRIKSDSKIIYIKIGENKGIAYALNKGIENAISDGYKYVMTLDQDSEMTSNIINQMMNFIESHDMKNIGIISPYQDIDSDEEKSKNEFDDVIEVMTSGNIINIDAYKKVGGFKEWMFIDCVDTEFCMNLHKRNYKVLRLNKIVMKHHLGNLTIHHFLGKNYPCYNHNPIRRYYIVRNTFYINQMYSDIYPDYCKHLIRIQKGQVKRIILFEKNKIKKLRMMHKGYLDFKKDIKGKIK